MPRRNGHWPGFTARRAWHPARVVWAPCPMTAMLSATLYIAIRESGDVGAADHSTALGQTLQRIIQLAQIPNIPPRMRCRIELDSEAAVTAALRFDHRLGNGLAAADAIENARRAELHRAFTSFEPGVEGRLDMLIVEPIRRGMRPLRIVLDTVLDASGEGELRLAAMLARFASFGGPLSFGHAALMDYLNRVLGIEIDRGFIDTAASCGLFWALDGVCFAAERPTHLNRNEAGQLHCEIGPSLAYPSGWSRWHWHGVSVPQEAVETPERITVEAIHRAGGPERRRVMIERYRTGETVCGIPAFLRDSGARLLDQDAGFGTLWRIDTVAAMPILMVEVENRSPEPDGSYRHFLLRVDPQLRPMLADGGFGEPQSLTARNAVASTFGLSGAEYTPQIET